MIFQDKKKVKSIVRTLLAFVVASVLCVGIMKIREIYFSDIPKQYFALMVLPIFFALEYIGRFLDNK